MPYLTGEDTWIPNEYDWLPNRLPAAWINLRPGNYCTATGGNFRGLQPWWYESDDDPWYQAPATWDVCEAFTDLYQKLDEAYGHGFRRFILNLPAGMVRAQNMASSQWWPMPEWKRNLFTCFIEEWLSNRPDTQFEVYGAFQVNDPASLCMTDNAYGAHTSVSGTCVSNLTIADGQKYYPCLYSDTAFSPSAFDQSDVCLFHTTNYPWQQLNFTRVWMDWAHHNWSDFKEFPYCPLYAPGTDEPHFLGMEAFPMDHSDPDHPEIVMSRAEHCPAIIFSGHIPSVDDDQSWDVSSNAPDTELVVVISTESYFESQHDSDSVYDMFDVLAWTQRGFVLGAQGVGSIGSDPASLSALALIEFMKRVYDFGPIANRADFNGDGTVDSKDQSDFSAAYALYQGKTGCNWVHGDLNGDNTVNLTDSLLFNSWRLFHMSNPSTWMPVTLGAAEPDDALTTP